MHERTVVALCCISAFAAVGCWSLQSYRPSRRLSGEHAIRKRQTYGAQCKDSEFNCGSKCISSDKTCNGFFDCDNDLDEARETCEKRNCSSSRFRCRSGSCIHKNKLCDGFLSCVDGDDETTEACRNNVCPVGKFRCNYGGCIGKRKVCDNETDCADGSDEANDLCSKNPKTPDTPTFKADPTRCTLPPVSADKTYEVKCPTDKDCGSNPGQTVPGFTTLYSACNSGFSRGDGTKNYRRFESSCQNGEWEPQLIACKKICPDLRRSDLNSTCLRHLGGPRVPCTSLLIEGAVLIPRCKQQYHMVEEVTFRNVVCKKDGTWDREVIKCAPDCGRTPSSSIPLILGGEPEKRGESPWNVVIYSTQLQKNPPEFICGGTLITTELVVSAAHCFYDQGSNRQLDASLFFVIVGKMTLDFAVKDFPSTKTFTVKKIFFTTQTEFTGASTNYGSDIVILQLSGRISLSQDVLPACVYWNDLKRFEISENALGKLSGFGKTGDELNSPSSPQLLTANLPFMTQAECRKKVSEEFRDSIALDKFCAGYVVGAGARPGDSGGGLLFQDKGDGLFYIRGVVSHKDVSSSSIAAFTDLTIYMPWIQQIIKTVDHSALMAETVEP